MSDTPDPGKSGGIHEETAGFYFHDDTIIESHLVQIKGFHPVLLRVFAKGFFHGLPCELFGFLEGVECEMDSVEVYPVHFSSLLNVKRSRPVALIIAQEPDDLFLMLFGALHDKAEKFVVLVNGGADNLAAYE